jgi:hypothetical protein
MSKGGSAALPTAPDPVATSNAQAAENRAAIQERMMSDNNTKVDLGAPEGYLPALTA